MRHVYECPTRWADLDVLGHVNNVVYVDYLQEARVDMLRVHARSPRTGALAEGTVVVSHQVTYLAPLHFRRTREGGTPVLIECWITEIRAASFTMAYEVFREQDGERTVYVRATTVLSPYVFATESPRRLSAEEKAGLETFLEPAPTPRPTFSEPRRLEAGHFQQIVRFSDVDAYRHVNNVKYFEYLQESRIALLTGLGGRGASLTRAVVAQADVVYRRPLFHRVEPYELWSWPTHLGHTAATIETVIVDPVDPETILAAGRSVLVFVDGETGRPTPPSEEMRAAFEAQM